MRTLIARGHPLDPGRRQPARRGREAMASCRPPSALRPRRPPSPPAPRRRRRRRRRRGGRVAMAASAAQAHGRRRGGTRRRRALARHLRGHDHAAVRAVHGPVLDLVGEHVEVRGALQRSLQDAFSGASCPAASALQETGGDDRRRPRSPPRRRSTAGRHGDGAGKADAQGRRRRGGQGRGAGLQGAQGAARRLRRQARPRRAR